MYSAILALFIPATTVVFVMAIVSAVILGIFDMAWSNLTELIYG